MDQQFIDALHEQDKIDQLVVDLDLAQYDNVVLSVNNKTGAVVLVTTDIAEGTNLYYTNTRADERVALLIDDALTNLTKAWSSQKITDAISLGVVASAAKWTNVMNFDFGGDLVGNGGFDGSSTATFSATVPGKVDNARVLTDVPAGALFTDTAYDDTTIWAAVNLNTAKTGITASQASEIEANNAKNSYPTEDQTKLLTVETGAEVNVQADWAETVDTEDSFIANRPPLTGRNVLINGGFDVWQRGDISFSDFGYTADRWTKGSNGVYVVSKSAGAVEYGNSGIYAYISITTPETSQYFTQKIEDVFTLNGKTATLSFRASGIAIENIIVTQNFGTGGSANVSISLGGIAASDTFNTLHELTMDIPSLSGKTVGDNSYLEVAFRINNNLADNSGVLRLRNVQLEEGLVATPFEQLPIGQTLSLCQRYYWQGKFVGSAQGVLYMGVVESNAQGGMVSFPSEMRATPTIEVINAPTYSKCTHKDYIVSIFGFAERVSVDADANYRSYGGTYSADAEID